MKFERRCGRSGHSRGQVHRAGGGSRRISECRREVDGMSWWKMLTGNSTPLRGFGSISNEVFQTGATRCKLTSPKIWPWCCTKLRRLGRKLLLASVDPPALSQRHRSMISLFFPDRVWMLSHSGESSVLFAHPSFPVNLSPMPPREMK